MIIAITGCIGSGKSYILNQINKLYNYDIFSADEIAKNSYEDKTIQNKLQLEFNCIINGKVDKDLLKKQLNESTIKKLNNIIHPYVRLKIEELKTKYSNKIAFIEVPLLFESKMEDLFDLSIAIYVDDKLRHLRLKQRNIDSYNSMIKLEKYQFSNEKKASLADYVLYSSDNDLKNIEQLKTIINKIKEVGD